MLMRDKFFIGGQWVAPSTKESIDVHNAGTGEVMGTVPAGAEKDIDAAVAAARAAFDAWSRDAAREARRVPAEDLRRAEGARRRARPRPSRRKSACRSSSPAASRPGCRSPTSPSTRRCSRDFQFEERVGNSLVVREPVGVVGAITPWNYPLHQIALKVAPALAAGCTVVLKPSEVAPFNAFILAEVIEAAGLPKGVFNLVTGYGPAVGEALAKHPQVDMISFTGSTRAGKRISEARRADGQARGAGARRQVAPR